MPGNEKQIVPKSRKKREITKTEMSRTENNIKIANKSKIWLFKIKNLINFCPL